MNDRKLWIEARMVNAPAVTAARTTKLGIQQRLARERYRSALGASYDKLTRHDTPAHSRWGQRLSERAIAFGALASIR